MQQGYNGPNGLSMCSIGGTVHPQNFPKDRLVNPPIDLLNNPLEEVQSFKLLGLTISHDLSWANHIPKLVSKASHQLGILRHTRSFLGTPELRIK